MPGSLSGPSASIWCGRSSFRWLSGRAWRSSCTKNLRCRSRSGNRTGLPTPVCASPGNEQDSYSLHKRSQLTGGGVPVLERGAGRERDSCRHPWINDTSPAGITLPPGELPGSRPTGFAFNRAVRDSDRCWAHPPVSAQLRPILPNRLHESQIPVGVAVGVHLSFAPKSVQVVR